MTDKIYVLANESVAEECMRKAIDWSSVATQTKFKDNPEIKAFAIQAVAEYLANETGFTMYKENAKYPKPVES